MFHRRAIKPFVFAACLLAGAMSASAGALPADKTPLDAVWRVHQIELNVRTGRIFYSCEGLRAKIAAILTEVGAREDLSVHVPCRSGGLTNNTAALITLASPIEATPDNVRQVTTYSSAAQLAARLNRIHLPTANDVERFTVERRSIALSRIRSLGLDAGDCPLLRALTTQVFPQMDVQISEHRLSCSDSVGRLRPKLHVMALMPTAEPAVFMTADRNQRHRAR